MEPKDMPNVDLLIDYVTLARSYSDCEWTEATCPQFVELLRRLNEADALRKENEELRNAHAKLLKDYAELRVNSALLVACDDALESMDANESKESEASHDR